MNMAYVYFNELPLKTYFYQNGNKYLKRSTRTADLLEFGRWFYFGKKELCVVAPYCRLADDYFDNSIRDTINE